MCNPQNPRPPVLSGILWMCLWLLLTGTALSQGSPVLRGGRSDVAIKDLVRQQLASRPEFRNVRVMVDDAVATLEGSVELFSQRNALTGLVSRVRHVQGVINLVTLDPPAVRDEVLLMRVGRSLDRWKALTVRVHEGRVTVSGALRDRREWNRMRMAIWSTPGVKEVEDQTQIVSSGSGQ